MGTQIIPLYMPTNVVSSCDLTSCCWNIIITIVFKCSLYICIGHEEFPTLLHFAARFGLERLSMQLLDCPGGDIAYEIRNAYDLTPAEIAENAGHHELANILSGYMVY